MPIPAAARAIVRSGTTSEGATREMASGPRSLRYDPRMAPGDLDGARVVRRREPVAFATRRLQRRDRALVDDPSAAHDRDAVAQLLDLGELVAREQDGDALGGEPLDRARACRACPPDRGRSRARRAAAAAGCGSARPRCRGAAACRASSRRPCRRRGSSRSTMSSASSMRSSGVAAIQAGEQLEVRATPEVGVEAGRLDEAARLRRARVRPRSADPGRTASRCPRSDGSDRGACAARLSSRPRSGRGIRTRHPAPPSGRRGRPRRSRRTA